MRQVVILERPIPERRYDDDYDALTADLEELGWEVVEPPRIEYRSGIVPPDVVDAAIRVMLRLACEIAEEKLDELVDAVRQRLRKPKRGQDSPMRECIIYGRDDRPLKVIRLDEGAE